MILLVGATGETSRRIIQYALQQDVELRLAVRNIDTARRRLAGLGADFEMCRVDASDMGSVVSALGPGDVLLNAATPSGALGHGLARAAIMAGAHYMDFSGEVRDTLRMLRELDEPARERGVTLCPGAGYSGATGDFAVRLALKKMPDATAGVTGYFAGGFTPSYGTLLSEMEILSHPGVVVEHGELVERETLGSIHKIGGRTLVERPLADPILVSRYMRFESFRSGIDVPAEAAEQTAEMFTSAASGLKDEKGRLAYLEKIGSAAGQAVEEEPAFVGFVTAYLSRGDESTQAAITSWPIYEQTARMALLISRELDDGGRPTGFQAPSSVVNSIEGACAQLGVTPL
ncbi:saccharopine dehydrogenase NADP-binding domain-containing protein [Noviherbaspirillum sedimenti]|uniref:Saccharopine dehydrogenase NADP binding domain-containing protein n=1 Tax=Noviherbaspirillum sedimenti TaxID=2320865 RepID=A0A3A3G4B3_9BURK|nr:saccharopine dehydrogenase NADP-binding domain-containing protein [Noviherbaspirillum sedimenti]RJG01342.1 hypothetical protein D3878_06885 [Noviherbaspirillum sedimenti]